jgi:hypothetical protein
MRCPPTPRYARRAGSWRAADCRAPRGGARQSAPESGQEPRSRTSVARAPCLGWNHCRPSWARGSCRRLRWCRGRALGCKRRFQSWSPQVGHGRVASRLRCWIRRPVARACPERDLVARAHRSGADAAKGVLSCSDGDATALASSCVRVNAVSSRHLRAPRAGHQMMNSSCGGVELGRRWRRRDVCAVPAGSSIRTRPEDRFVSSFTRPARHGNGARSGPPGVNGVSTACTSCGCESWAS